MEKQPDAVQPIPEGYHSVTPWIISRDTARLLDFMSKAFGAEELGRVYNEDGTIGHAEAKIGDCIVMAFDARREWPPTPCFLRLYVPDGDAVYQQAIAAGATSVTEMTSLSFGDRVGRDGCQYILELVIQAGLQAPREVEAVDHVDHDRHPVSRGHLTGAEDSWVSNGSGRPSFVWPTVSRNVPARMQAVSRHGTIDCRRTSAPSWQARSGPGGEAADRARLSSPAHPPHGSAASVSTDGRRRTSNRGRPRSRMAFNRPCRAA